MSDTTTPCYIYKSLKKNELYLYLREKDDFALLPDALYQSVQPIQLVMELALTPDRKLAREDAAKVIASLQDKGYFVQLPPMQESAVH